jgi:hypothetical protein
MSKSVTNHILYLPLAGIVFVVVNAALYLAAQDGQIAPIDNMALWGSFVVFNICSLLWAAFIFGLHPLVAAASYAAGAAVSYMAVRLQADLPAAEIATAGATCSAIGALVVSCAAASKERTALERRQAPFVFALLAMLLLDAGLSSRIVQAGSSVIMHAAVIPFLFCGIVVGLAWVLVVRMQSGHKTAALTVPSVENAEQSDPSPQTAGEEMENSHLMFSVPTVIDDRDDDGLEDSEDAEEPAEEVQPVAAVLEADPVSEEPAGDDDLGDDFFPLEIDNSDELTDPEPPDLINVAALVAESAPEPIEDAEPEVKPEAVPEPPQDEIISASTEIKVEEETSAEPEPVIDPETPTLREGKAVKGDWLNSHLDLLNKIK